MRKTKYHQGRYKPQHPEKYIGDIKNIVYRSSYELKFMRWCDTNSSVIKWSSEERVIPYRSPIDNKVHRYFPDFEIKVKTADNALKTIIIEVKPSVQTVEPKVKTRKTKRYLNEVKTYAINTYKWKYAKEWCRKRGYEFAIITEKDLAIK